MKKILIVAAMILCLVGFLFADARWVAPKRYTIRHEKISDEKIPLQLDQMKILYFSDLDYGTYMEEKRLTSLIQKINQSSPDTVIFGGDLFDHNVTPDQTAIDTVTAALKSIKAEYGKFVVFGDTDQENADKEAAIRTIYQNSGFELIENSSISLHHGGSQSITFVGMGNPITGTQDVETAYASVSNNNFVLTVAHTPDSADQVPEDLTDYFLAGHSHGGQAYYLFSSLYSPEYATTYLRGSHVVDNAFTLDITNGVGTTVEDIRFLANAEIVVYELKHKTRETKKTVTKEKTAEPETEAKQHTEEDAAQDAEQSSSGNE